MTAIADVPDFGQYELLARIGEAPRGPVFVARRTGDATSDLLYVLALSTFATGEDEPMRAFVRDVESVARIRHPNLLGIVEIGVNTGGHYVVMDHVEGATLSAVHDRHRAIRPPRLVMTTIIDALNGLHAAHSIREDGLVEPLIHGSLSPDHLIVGLDGTCRVAGFGHMRPRVQTKPSHRSTTATGYLAPEQLTGAAIDPRSDLFALAVVLWNALTGKRLFHDRLEHMTMSNVLERKVPRPSAIGLCPPPALDSVVMKALERDPGRRFQAAAEMASALRDAARAAACLAPGTEVGEWISTTFGSDLATRRRALRDLGARPAAQREIPVLPPPGGAAPADTGADELALDELARATASQPRQPTQTQTPIAVAPIAYPEAPPRRQLAIIAAASFAVVAIVLGWRWSVAAPAIDETATLEPGAAEPPLPGAALAPLPIELEVTVLDVHSAANEPATAPATPAAPATATAPMVDPATARTIVPAAIAPAPPRAEPIAASPGRSPPRAKKPQRAAAPARAEAPSEAPGDPPEARPAATHPDTAPAKPEAPPRPAMEPNPYLYK